MLKLDQCISWPQETAISSSVWLPFLSHDSEAVALFLRIKQTRILRFILALEAAAFHAQKYRLKLPPLQTWLWKSKFCIHSCFKAGLASCDQEVWLALLAVSGLSHRAVTRLLFFRGVGGASAGCWVSFFFFFFLSSVSAGGGGGGGREHSAWQYLHLSAVLFFVILGAVFVAERCRGNRRLEVRGGGGGVVERRLVTQTPLWHGFCCASIFDPLSSLPCLRPFSTLHHHSYYY